MVRKVCEREGKPEDAFFTEVIPVLVATVKRARETILQKEKEPANHRAPDDFLQLRMEEGQPTIIADGRDIMGCASGMCDMDVEFQILETKGLLMKLGWNTIELLDPADYRERLASIRKILDHGRTDSNA